MWKLLLAFILFAMAALFVLKKAGGNVDMGGEKHSVETPAAEAPAASAPPAASAAVPAASAASQ